MIQSYRTTRLISTISFTRFSHQNSKLTGMSMCFPTLDFSIVDLTVNPTKPAKYEEICAAMKEAAEEVSIRKGI